MSQASQHETGNKERVQYHAFHAALERIAGEKKPIKVHCFFFCDASTSTPAVDNDDVACSSLRLCSEKDEIDASEPAMLPPVAELEPVATGEAAGVTAGESVVPCGANASGLTQNTMQKVVRQTRTDGRGGQ